ncbi:MAG: VanZ family protein [Flavobacteriales bacterium]
MRKTNFVTLLLFILGIFLIFFLSWKADPNIGEFSYVPDWLAEWTDADRNNRRRTAVPFVALGILAGGFMIYIKRTKLLFWFFAFLLLSTIVALAEAGQYFLPSRSPDLKDVIWGVVGAFIGLSLTYLMSKLINAVKTRF